jgi:hypothetical protein
VADLTGPIPDHVTADLEALKRQLIGMGVGDLPEKQAQAMAREISAIRLHLKRIEFDRAAAAARVSDS